MLFFPDRALALYIQCFAPGWWLLFVCHPLSHLPPMPTVPGQASQSHPRLHTPGSLFSGPCPELLPKKKKKSNRRTTPQTFWIPGKLSSFSLNSEPHLQIILKQNACCLSLLIAWRVPSKPASEKHFIPFRLTVGDSRRFPSPGSWLVACGVLWAGLGLPWARVRVLGSNVRLLRLQPGPASY